MMKPNAPTLLRAVEHFLTGYADRVVTREQAKVAVPRLGTHTEELIIRKPRKPLITHAELLAAANQFLDDLADGIAPPIGKTLTFEDKPLHRPLPFFDDDDQ
jgi:hypothetical protein